MLDVSKRKHWVGSSVCDTCTFAAAVHWFPNGERLNPTTYQKLAQLPQIRPEKNY